MGQPLVILLIALSASMAVWAIAQQLFSYFSPEKSKIQQRLSNNWRPDITAALNKPVTISLEMKEMPAFLARSPYMQRLYRKLVQAYPEAKLTTFLSIYGPVDRQGFHRSVNITVRAKTPELMPEALEETRQVLRHDRGLKPGQEDNFDIFTSQSLVAGGPYASRVGFERIAHHLASAGQHSEALFYWDQAGRRALKRAAFLEAAEHFRRALEALERGEPPGKILRLWEPELAKFRGVRKRYLLY